MKLGKVEFCHLLQIIALFLCLSGMNQAEPSRSRSKPYFQSGRTRTKRSWVWNQFFVLEEYMGTDPLYVGKEKKIVEEKRNTFTISWYKRKSSLSSGKSVVYIPQDTINAIFATYYVWWIVHYCVAFGLPAIENLLKLSQT